MVRLTVADDEEQLAGLAAERVTQLIEAAVVEYGYAFVSLTGGTTPRRLYSCLGNARRVWRDRIPWPRVHLFWGDERHVPPGHPDSNFGMAKNALLDRVPVPAEHVHRIRGELADAGEAAEDYERELNDVGSAVRPPRVASAFRRKNYFDLMLLGLGEDAHIASIFPKSPLLREMDPEHVSVGPLTGRRVAAVWAPHLDAWRITLTPAAILDSRAIVMLVSGQKKATAVQAALEAPLDIVNVPAHLLNASDERVEWFVDRAASSRLQ